MYLYRIHTEDLMNPQGIAKTPRRTVGFLHLRDFAVYVTFFWLSETYLRKAIS